MLLTLAVLVFYIYRSCCFYNFPFFFSFILCFKCLAMNEVSPWKWNPFLFSMESNKYRKENVHFYTHNIPNRLCMQGKHNLPVASLFMTRRKRLTLEHAKYAESSMIPRSKAICVFPSIVTLFVYTLYYFKQSTLNIFENFTFILDSRYKK